MVLSYLKLANPKIKLEILVKFAAQAGTIGTRTKNIHFVLRIGISEFKYPSVSVSVFRLLFEY